MSSAGSAAEKGCGEAGDGESGRTTSTASANWARGEVSGEMDAVERRPLRPCFSVVYARRIRGLECAELGAEPSPVDDRESDSAGVPRGERGVARPASESIARVAQSLAGGNVS